MDRREAVFPGHAEITQVHLSDLRGVTVDGAMKPSAYSMSKARGHSSSPSRDDRRASIRAVHFGGGGGRGTSSASSRTSSDGTCKAQGRSQSVLSSASTCTGQPQSVRGRMCMIDRMWVDQVDLEEERASLRRQVERLRAIIHRRNEIEARSLANLDLDLSCAGPAVAAFRRRMGIDSHIEHVQDGVCAEHEGRCEGLRFELSASEATISQLRAELDFARQQLDEATVLRQRAEETQEQLSQARAIIEAKDDALTAELRRRTFLERECFRLATAARASGKGMAVIGEPRKQVDALRKHLTFSDGDLPRCAASPADDTDQLEERGSGVAADVRTPPRRGDGESPLRTLYFALTENQLHRSLALDDTLSPEHSPDRTPEADADDLILEEPSLYDRFVRAAADFVCCSASRGSVPLRQPAAFPIIREYSEAWN